MPSFAFLGVLFLLIFSVAPPAFGSAAVAGSKEDSFADIIDRALEKEFPDNEQGDVKLGLKDWKLLTTWTIYSAKSGLQNKEMLSHLSQSSPNVVAVLDHERKRTFVLKKDGLPDVAVWNPWEKKSKLMSDFGDEECKQMVCVDAAAIERPITLRAGEEWKGRLELAVVPSSYCSERFDH